MKRYTNRLNFDPSACDLNLDVEFDLTLQPLDYLLLGLYLVLVFPVVVLTRLGGGLLRLITGSSATGRNRPGTRPSLKETFSLISKLF